MLTHSPRAFPLGVTAPVGTLHVTQKHCHLPRVRRPRPRICLRKGCGRKYQPRCWHQRYCQDPECLRQVRRWQAARRQAKRRQDDLIQAQHAEVEREAGSELKLRPRPLRTRKLCLRVVTQHKIFSPPLMQSARLPRTHRDLHPQPGSLLLRRLPSGGSQRPGPGTQVAFSRDFGWPQETGHRILGRRRNRLLRQQTTTADSPPRAPPQ